MQSMRSSPGNATDNKQSVMSSQKQTSTSHSSASSVKKARNDSSNVSAVLAPDRRPPHKAHCENCYCLDAPHPALLRLPLKHHHQKGATTFKKTLEPTRLSTSETSSFAQHECSTLPDGGGSYHNQQVERATVGCQTENLHASLDRETLAFRNDHYFECHSVENLRPTQGHKCLHRFTVNDRLMLEPINCDSFGVSRCELCAKPMERSRQPTPPPKTLRALAPPKLNIGSGGERVEIRVPEGVGRECFAGFKFGRRHNRGAANSFALRFQK